jgi:hypothetical protein
MCLVRRGRERGVPFFPYGTARSHDTEKKKVDLARQINFGTTDMMFAVVFKATIKLISWVITFSVNW